MTIYKKDEIIKIVLTKYTKWYKQKRKPFRTRNYENGNKSALKCPKKKHWEMTEWHPKWSKRHEYFKSFLHMVNSQLNDWNECLTKLLAKRDNLKKKTPNNTKQHHTFLTKKLNNELISKFGKRQTLRNYLVLIWWPWNHWYKSRTNLTFHCLSSCLQSLLNIMKNSVWIKFV